jgi:hypothetical protein
MRIRLFLAFILLKMAYFSDLPLGEDSENNVTLS